MELKLPLRLKFVTLRNWSVHLYSFTAKLLNSDENRSVTVDVSEECPVFVHMSTQINLQFYCELKMSALSLHACFESGTSLIGQWMRRYRVAGKCKTGKYRSYKKSKEMCVADAKRRFRLN